GLDDGWGGLWGAGVAGGGLANQGEHLAAGEREADPVHRVHPFPAAAGEALGQAQAHRVVGLEVRHFEQRDAGPLPLVRGGPAGNGARGHGASPATRSEDRPSADRPPADRASADRPPADRASADRASADRASANRASADPPKGLAPSRRARSSAGRPVRWHAARWPGATRVSTGWSRAHGSKYESQRGRNGHPVISRSSRGGAPGMETTSSSPYRSGVAANSSLVEGWLGAW